MASPETGAPPSPRAAGEAAISGTLLGFDFGERRIGVAVGETITRIASPLGSIAERGNEARFAAIAKLVAEWRPVMLVVGRPKHADGSPHEVARLAEKFARRLRAFHGLPIAFVDETLSSATAEAELRASRTRARKPGDLDAAAARIILQSYLDDPRVHERLA